MPLAVRVTDSTRAVTHHGRSRALTTPGTAPRPSHESLFDPLVHGPPSTHAVRLRPHAGAMVGCRLAITVTHVQTTPRAVIYELISNPDRPLAVGYHLSLYQLDGTATDTTGHIVTIRPLSVKWVEVVIGTEGPGRAPAHIRVPSYHLDSSVVLPHWPERQAEYVRLRFSPAPPRWRRCTSAPPPPTRALLPPRPTVVPRLPPPPGPPVQAYWTVGHHYW